MPRADIWSPSTRSARVRDVDAGAAPAQRGPPGYVACSARHASCLRAMPPYATPPFHRPPMRRDMPDTYAAAICCRYAQLL